MIKNFFAFLVLFCIYSTITDGLFDLGNKWFGWNVNRETELNFLFFFSLFLSLLTVYRPFRRNFLQRFIVIGNAKQAIIYGLLTGFLLQVFVETTRYIPLLFDRDVVNIGSGQFSAEDNKIAPMAAFLLVSLIGPFNEEFIFRYLLFELIVISVRRFITNSEFSIHSRLSSAGAQGASNLFFLHPFSFQPRYPVKILSVTYINWGTASISKSKLKK
jgi:membrane protease YdiL (CAAX protease family)